MTRRAPQLIAAVFAAVLATAVPSAAQVPTPTITVRNASSSQALVRLKGATDGQAEVGPGENFTFEVPGGTYQLLIRYGSGAPYRYAEGDPFSVTQTMTEVEHVTVTLHTIYGNMQERPISAQEFASQ